MKTGMTVTKPIRFGMGQGRRKVLIEGEASENEFPVRIPRISRLMAMAIRMRKLVEDGEVADFADLARLAHVSRARITQIMNLLHLAPDIQEEILHLPPGDGGRDAVSERAIRSLVSIVDWRKQRKVWNQLTGK